MEDHANKTKNWYVDVATEQHSFQLSSSDFRFNIKQKQMLVQIGNHFKNIGYNSFNKIKNTKDPIDPFAELHKANKLVIKNCHQFLLLVDLLKYMQSTKRQYSQNLVHARLWIRMSGGKNLYDLLYHNMPLPADSRNHS